MATDAQGDRRLVESRLRGVDAALTGAVGAATLSGGVWTAVNPCRSHDNG